MACSPDPAQGLRCGADSLCITVADFPQSPFCSAHVPQRRRLPGRRALPRAARRRRCRTARARWSGCARPNRRSCGHGCVREVGLRRRPGLRLRTAAAPACAICRATAATKSLGTACASPAECRSGECFDRDWHVGGGSNRAVLLGRVHVNSDCGADQRCARLVVGNNGTPRRSARRPGVGLLPLAVRADRWRWLRRATPTASRARTARTRCDTTHGLCYKKAAAPGAACTTRRATARWAASAASGPRFPGGYCQTFGCAAGATSGVNACPGDRTASARSAAAPTSRSPACYERLHAQRRGQHLQPRERGLRVRIADGAGAAARRSAWWAAGRNTCAPRRSLALVAGAVAAGPRSRAGAAAAPPPAAAAAGAGVRTPARARSRVGRAAVAAPRRPPTSRRPPAQAPSGVGPIPTADETPAASDHDAVVGHVGIEARRFDPGPLPLDAARRPRLPAAGAARAAA